MNNQHQLSLVRRNKISKTFLFHFNTAASLVESLFYIVKLRTFCIECCVHNQSFIQNKSLKFFFSFFWFLRDFFAPRSSGGANLVYGPPKLIKKLLQKKKKRLESKKKVNVSCFHCLGCPFSSFSLSALNNNCEKSTSTT